MSAEGRKNYYRRLYDHLPRWSSYWHQINEIAELRPETVLEIGVGNGTVYNYLKKLGVKITACDIDESLEPDVAASVMKLPFADDSFDAVLAAEVLEHLPYEELRPALREIRRVSRKYAVISLPHWGRTLLFLLKIPAFPPVKFLWKLPGFKRHSLEEKEKNGHWWEIGKRGFGLRRIKREMAASGFKILKDYAVFEHPYHHFFVLEKQNSQAMSF